MTVLGYTRVAPIFVPCWRGRLAAFRLLKLVTRVVQPLARASTAKLKAVCMSSHTQNVAEPLPESSTSLMPSAACAHSRTSTRTGKTLSEAAARYSADGGETPRGEFVIIVEGVPEEAAAEHYTPEQAAELAKSLMEEGLSVSEAAKEAAKVTHLKKGDIYKLLVQ